MLILNLRDVDVNENHRQVRIKQGQQCNCRPNVIFLIGRKAAAICIPTPERVNENIAKPQAVYSIPFFYFAAFSAAWAAASRAMGTR
jgi:hypothetical protein